MGGIGMTVRIEKTGEDGDLEAFHRATWDLIWSRTRWRLESRGNRVVTESYIWDAASDGFHDGLWDRDPSSISFVFKDYAGCCNLSCEVALHWTRLTLGTLATPPASNGYRVVGPALDLRSELVRGPDYPAVYVRSGLVAVVRRSPGVEPAPGEEVAFGDSRLVDAGSLSPTDREKVDWAGMTGQCLCDVCVYLRSRVTPVKHRTTVKKGIRAVRAAWGRLADAPDDLVTRAHSGLLPASWAHDAPPEGLAVLADWLEERDAAVAIDVLAGMVCNLRRR